MKLKINVFFSAILFSTFLFSQNDIDLDTYFAFGPSLGKYKSANLNALLDTFNRGANIAFEYPSSMKGLHIKIGDLTNHNYVEETLSFFISDKNIGSKFDQNFIEQTYEMQNYLLTLNWLLGYAFIDKEIVAIAGGGVSGSLNYLKTTNILYAESTSDIQGNIAFEIFAQAGYLITERIYLAVQPSFQLFVLSNPYNDSYYKLNRDSDNTADILNFLSQNLFSLQIFIGFND